MEAIKEITGAVVALAVKGFILGFYGYVGVYLAAEVLV